MFKTVVVIIPCLLHLYFMYLEVFLWEKKRVISAFAMTPDFAAQTKVMAINQGIYNGFLAGGIIWSFLAAPSHAQEIQIYFLSCMFLAGVVGALTVTRRIFWIQSAPALLALIVVGLF
jgi:putative membrane protein